MNKPIKPIISRNKDVIAVGSYYFDGKNYHEKPCDLKILELEEWIKNNPKRTERHLAKLQELKNLKLMAMNFYLA